MDAELKRQAMNTCEAHKYGGCSHVASVIWDLFTALEKVERELDALDLSRVVGFATKNGVLTLYTTEESMRNRIGESDTWTRAGWVDAVERVEIHDDGT